MVTHLNGRSVLVTGASRGIGQAIARMLGEHGARVHALARDPSPVEELARAGLGPPRVEELAERLHFSPSWVADLLKTAIAEGLVVKVADDMYFERRVLDALRERLVGHLREHREITTQAFKEMVGQTRKWVIPLSEYFDREKVTLRVGEKRVLRKG